MKAALEGLLFIVGDDGLEKDEIIDILDIDEEKCDELLSSLKEDYHNDDRGIELSFLGNRYKLTTKSQYKDYYAKLCEIEEMKTLSQSALETLAIIAYNQPVTRSAVDNIRGVSSSHLIRKLVSKDLVREMGRSNLPGRPILYGITDGFLDYFGLSSVDELPKVEMEENTLEEVDLYNSKYSEEDEVL